ncbi:MAG: hypothetical protein WC501_00985 [Candidatus Micrarchaeia archaeon]
MVIKKIVFFIETQLTQRNFDRFGIAILKNNGFLVEIWNFGLALHPEIYRTKEETNPMKYKGCKVFTTVNEGLEEMNNLTEEVMVLMLVGYLYPAFRIYNEISRKKIKYCNIKIGALPTAEAVYTKDAWNKLKGLTVKKSINSIFCKMPFRLLGIKPAELVLTSGSGSIKTVGYPIDKTSKILNIHSFDYDTYLQEKTNKYTKRDNIAVFLDECVPFHIDGIQLGLPYATKAEEYYPSLCRFFDFVEKKLGVKIIIAAHPTANYEKNSDYFGGRETIKNSTAKLVRESKFVICHSSTSIGFAVLFKKPIVCITTNPLENSWQRGMIHQMASAFGKKPINIDDGNFWDIKKELEMQVNKYEEYCDRYIKKSGTEELPFWQIFSNYIKTEYK